MLIITIIIFVAIIYVTNIIVTIIIYVAPAAFNDFEFPDEDAADNAADEFNVVEQYVNAADDDDEDGGAIRQTFR